MEFYNIDQLQFCEMRAMHDRTHTDDTGFTYSLNYRHVTFICKISHHYG